MSSSATSVTAELDYPIAVVTCPARAAAQSEKQGSGCVVGFWTQCSIDPERFVVCVSKANHTHQHAMASDVLAVHVLDESEIDLARIFGELTGDEVDKLDLVQWSPGPGGVPVLDDASVWFAGRVLDRLDLGDHTGFVLETIVAEQRRWRAQLGYQTAKELDPGHPA